MIIAFLVGIGLGLGLGAGIFIWRSKAAALARRRIPQEWPLKVRPLVSKQQQRVWFWLTKVMFDQQVMVKLPVTRFTAPAVSDNAAHWYELLNGVYCTFTVCNMNGKVIGCVDVQGYNTPSMSNQTLKHSLLSQCGIHYWVVDPTHLPSLVQLRTAFLGEQAVRDTGRDGLESRFNNVRENLQAAVTRRRHSKSSTGHDTDSELGDTQFPDSRMGSDWDQNSFMSPLDSRSNDLGR
jgi:hypothetical protein